MSWSAIILCPHDDGSILHISCGHKKLQQKKIMHNNQTKFSYY